MRKLLLLSLSLLLSCNSRKEPEEKPLITAQHEKIFKTAQLNTDDVLILEVHYPEILKKIALQHMLDVRDILTLHDIGLETDTLIHLMKYTGSNYMLTADDVIYLQLGGVPLEVINYMIES